FVDTVAGPVGAAVTESAQELLCALAGEVNRRPNATRPPVSVAAAARPEIALRSRRNNVVITTSNRFPGLVGPATSGQASDRHPGGNCTTNVRAASGARIGRTTYMSGWPQATGSRSMRTVSMLRP